jgi:hypothetical protein
MPLDRYLINNIRGSNPRKVRSAQAPKPTKLSSFKRAARWAGEIHHPSIDAIIDHWRRPVRRIAGFAVAEEETLKGGCSLRCLVS